MLIGILRQFLAYIFCPIVTAISAVLAFLGSFFLSSQNLDKLIRFWAYLMCFFGGIDIEVEGLENIDPSKNYVLFSNHLSAFDIPVLYLALPLSFRMAAKAELFLIPIFGQAMLALGFFPVRRGHARASAKVLVHAAKQLQESNRSVWLAPEGTRIVGETLGPFKRGAFRIAASFKKPLLPVCIFGTDRVMRKSSWVINDWQWRQTVWVKILAPMEVGPDSETEVDRLTSEGRALLESHFQDLKKSKLNQNS